MDRRPMKMRRLPARQCRCASVGKLKRRKNGGGSWGGEGGAKYGVERREVSRNPPADFSATRASSRHLPGRTRREMCRPSLRRPSQARELLPIRTFPLGPGLEVL